MPYHDSLRSHGAGPIIDVHFHTFLPNVLKPLDELILAAPEETEAAMAKLGTAAVIYSPVIWSKYSVDWPVERWAEFCKQVTDTQASLVTANPATRGSFAPLPIPHVEATLEALEYCERSCSPKPDGYAITTSANNIYLGDPKFEPILAECDKRKAVLFVHPNETIMPPLDKRVYGFQMIEFPTETARCLMTMVDRGTFTKFPNIRWIFSHSGGSFPFLFQRVIRTLSGSKLIGVGGPGVPPVNRISQNNNGKTVQEIFATGNIFFECSQGTPQHQVLLKSLGLGPQNILSGTDWPFTGKEDVQDTLNELLGPERSGLYDSSEIEDIRAGNALRICPRLKQEWQKAGWIS